MRIVVTPSSGSARLPALVEDPERLVVRLTNSNGQPFPGRSIAPIVIQDGVDQIVLGDFEELCTNAPDTVGQ
jgi:hypothetical protein